MSFAGGDAKVCNRSRGTKQPRSWCRLI